MNTGGPAYDLARPTTSMTVRPGVGGCGKRTRSDLSPRGVSTFSASRRAMRFSMLWASDALDALAPKRSTKRCMRAISFAWRTAMRVWRSSSAARAATYCE